VSPEYLPGKLLQTALTATGLLALQASLFDGIGIGLHLLTRPFSFLASLCEAHPSEGYESHFPLTVP